jgi:kanamycin kinase
MKRTPIPYNPDLFSQTFHPLLRDAHIYDSSSSPDARVYFIQQGTAGYYLKTSPKGMLARETQLNRYFHSLKLGPEVLAYESSHEQDWMLTRQIPGEDCTHAQYLANPNRLADTIAGLLRALHGLSPAGCPVNHTESYIQAVQQNHRLGIFDPELFPIGWGTPSLEEAHRIAESALPCLKTDTLLHGDYCLPNIMLNDWKLIKFIDVDHGGVGDRHIDLFWGAWSLFFNLKTDEYRERFFDAYGRDVFEPEMLRVIAAAEVFG